MVSILLALIILILINALYVAAEFAAVGVRHTQIKALVDDGSLLASKLYPIISDTRNLDRYIACSQVGITLSSLVLGALGQFTLGSTVGDFFVSLFDMSQVQAYSMAAALILITLTSLQVIFGELLPKSIALQFPIKVAIWTVVPMMWSLKFLGPFITFLNGSGSALLNLLNIEPATHSHAHSPQEIAMLIAESRKGGFLQEEEFKRLNQALSLSSKTAHQIMIPRQDIVAVDINLPVDEIIEKIIYSPYTRLPVYRDMIDNIVGIVRVKDLVAKYSKDESFGSIQESITPATFIPDTISSERVLTQLREHGTHQALVIDEHGSLKGLITIEDILSELFGEISDEFKINYADHGCEELGIDYYRVSGKFRLDHLSQKTGINFDCSADTLNGFIFEKLGHLPVPNELITIEEWEIRVQKVQNHTVSTALIRRIKSPKDKIDANISEEQVKQ